jgi:hypothetical protein
MFNFPMIRWRNAEYLFEMAKDFCSTMERKKTLATFQGRVTNCIPLPQSNSTIKSAFLKCFV